MNTGMAIQANRISFIESYLEVMDYHTNDSFSRISGEFMNNGTIHSTIYLVRTLDAHAETVVKDLSILFSNIPEYGITDKQLDEIKQMVNKHCNDNLLVEANRANINIIDDLGNSIFYTRAKKQIELGVDIGIYSIKNKRDANKAIEQQNRRLVIVGWFITATLALVSIPAIWDLFKSP